jgi:hypothetical protein
MAKVTQTPFVAWWRALNIALAARSEPPAAQGEAMRWYQTLEPNNSKRISPTLLNHIICERRMARSEEEDTER